MKKLVSFFNLVVVLSLAMVSGCGTPATDTPPESVGVTPASPTAISPTPSTSQPFPSLQTENDLPQTLLVTKQSSELAENRIGAVAEARHIDHRVWEAGLKWFHLIPDPDGRWQYLDWEKDEYTIDPKEDQVVDDLIAHKMRIMLVLDVWHVDHRVVYDKTEEDIAIYLNWVRFMVRHFKGRIEYYEILNEPDMSFETPSGMPVVAYVNLVQRTVPVIREEDPEAKIVVGSVPNTSLNYCRDWLLGVLSSQIMASVDGVSWHGMFGPAPSDDPRGVWYHDRENQMANYWENYPAFIEQIKSVAISHGFDGEFFDEDMVWRTPSESAGDEPSGFTDVSGAKYYARAIVMHLGMDVYAGLSLPPDDTRPISFSVIRAMSTVMAGAQPVDLPVVIESNATNIQYYGFTLPNGDNLLAVWTDGAAVEDDPGVSATLTFPNSSAKIVTGIDILNGFEQELIAASENGDLIIRNLLVKDYPIILRFAGASFAKPGIVEPTAILPEPVTIKLKKNAQERVPAGTPIQLTTNWLADSQEHVTDFLAAASLHGTLDGQPLPDLNGSWGSIVPYQDRGYITQWLYPLGVLSPGTHNLEVWCTLSQPVTDGYDLNNDGQMDMYSDEVWRFTIQIEVY